MTDAPTRGLALITGASSGIGEAFARRVAARGQDVALVARREDRLRKLADELAAQHGIKADAIGLDLTAPDAADRLAARLGDTPVDLLVNNAGFGLYEDFLKHDAGALHRMLVLNMIALTDLTRQFLPGMVARGRGGVINVASTAAFQPIPHNAAYAATKAYVLHLTEGLAEEVAAAGVKVVALCPGPTDTEFVDVALFPAGMAEKGKRMGLFMSADAVARTGLRALDRGEVVAIAGAVNTVAAWSVRLGPRAMVRKITGRIFGGV